MSKPDDTTIPWPVGRQHHSSCLLAGFLAGDQHSVVVVVGGWDNYRYTLSDLWIMKREQTLKEVCLGIINDTHVHIIMYVGGVCRNVLWLLSDGVCINYVHVHFITHE